jgi:hypothetical protein
MDSLFQQKVHYILVTANNGFTVSTKSSLQMYILVTANNGFTVSTKSSLEVM